MRKLILSIALSVALIFAGGFLLQSQTGCQEIVESFNPKPVSSTQPVTAQQRLDGLQANLTRLVRATNIAHSLGAFSNAKQWQKIQTLEASAQSAINLASAAIQEGEPKDIDSFLTAAEKAVQLYQSRTP